MDLISVIVPVYNVRQYLEKCINSILSQTYEKFELLLVNDGSTDGSELICEEYKKKDCRISVINKTNGGLSSARNAGIEVCKGKYVCFVDSDDFVTNNYLEYLHHMIVRDNSQIAICSACWWSDEKTYEVCKYSGERCISPEETYKLLFTKEKWFGVFAWNKLYMTELFKDIRYPEGYYFEDSGTTYKLIHKCNLISVGYEPHYYYRQQRMGQITSAFTQKKIDDKILFSEEMKEFFSQNYTSINGIYISYYINSLLAFYEKVVTENNDNNATEHYLKNKIYSIMQSLTSKKVLTKKVKVKLNFFCLGKNMYLLYAKLNKIRKVFG